MTNQQIDYIKYDIDEDYKRIDKCKQKIVEESNKINNYIKNIEKNKEKIEVLKNDKQKKTT